MLMLTAFNVITIFVRIYSTKHLYQHFSVWVIHAVAQPITFLMFPLGFLLCFYSVRAILSMQCKCSSCWSWIWSLKIFQRKRVAYSFTIIANRERPALIILRRLSLVFMDKPLTLAMEASHKLDREFTVIANNKVVVTSELTNYKACRQAVIIIHNLFHCLPQHILYNLNISWTNQRQDESW